MCEHMYLLIISDEASGWLVERKISDFETNLIVPKKKLDSKAEFNNCLRGRTITHIKINAILNRDELSIVIESVTPILK